jgi:hypothetical protein
MRGRIEGIAARNCLRRLVTSSNNEKKSICSIIGPADFNALLFSGSTTPSLLQGREPDLPLVVVSGTIGEDAAARL